MYFEILRFIHPPSFLKLYLFFDTGTIEFDHYTRDETRMRNLTLVLLNTDLSFFENTVDPDQLASDKDVLSDQDPHCLPL